VSATLLKDVSGNPVCMIGIARDITERKRAEEELKKHRDHLEELVHERTAELEKLNQKLQQEIAEGKRREEIIKRQTQEILEISTPVMQVWAGVVVAPLIGMLDSQRTQRFMEVLLDRIVETNSAVALVDITGVPTVDTQTAHHLIETISAVRLLGAQVVLTGVSPQIAQTLVHLGIDLSGVVTRSSLVAGLRVALELLNLQMVSGSKTHKEARR
jgi:rsbT co-antagonist protein RsbR